LLFGGVNMVDEWLASQCCQRCPSEKMRPPPPASLAGLALAGQCLRFDPRQARRRPQQHSGHQPTSGRPMYKRILVPVEDSSASSKALIAALQFALERGGRVRVLHAVDELAYVSGFEYTGEMILTAREAAAKVVDEALATAKAAGVQAGQVTDRRSWTTAWTLCVRRRTELGGGPARGGHAWAAPNR
jgi:hypothetical protein